MRDLLSSGAGPRDTRKIAQQNVATGEVSGRCLPGGSLENRASGELVGILGDDERVCTTIGDHTDILTATLDLHIGHKALVHLLANLARGVIRLGSQILPGGVISTDVIQIGGQCGVKVGH